MFLTRCLGNLQQKTRFLFVRRNSTIQDQPGSKLLTKLFLCLNLTRPQAHCFDNTTLKTECSVLTNHQNKIKRYPTLLPGTAVVTLCVTAAKMNRVWQQSLVCSPNVLPLAWISQSQSDKSPSCLPLCFFVALFHTVMCMTSSPNQSETITPNSPFEWMPESHKQSHAIPILPRPFCNFFFFLHVKSAGGFRTFQRLEEWQLAWWLSGSGFWVEEREKHWRPREQYGRNLQNAEFWLDGERREKKARYFSEYHHQRQYKSYFGWWILKKTVWKVEFVNVFFVTVRGNE